MSTAFEMEFLAGLGSLGAKVVDTTVYQCPNKQGKGVAAEKNANKACAKKGGQVSVTSCKPFKYVCNTNPCPTGYTRSATGACTPPAVCPAGTVKDAYGRCVTPNVSCGAGFTADASGNCMPNTAACPSGYIKNLLNQCVIQGNCPAGQTQNAYGQCTGNVGGCPAGYTMNALNQCIQNVGSCGVGYTLNAYGQCVPQSCPTGYTMNANGQCTVPQSCPSGYVMNVYGQCVQIQQQQQCPTGYTIDMYGQCQIPNNSVQWPAWLTPTNVTTNPYQQVVQPNPYVYQPYSQFYQQQPQQYYQQPLIQQIPAGVDAGTDYAAAGDQQYSDIYAPTQYAYQQQSYGAPAQWVDESTGVDATVAQVADTEYGNSNQPISPSMEMAQGQNNQVAIAQSMGIPSMDTIEQQEESMMGMGAFGRVRGVRVIRVPRQLPLNPSLMGAYIDVKTARFVG